MIKLKIILILILGLTLLNTGSAQQQINIVDENGLKQGKWIKKFENGNILYEGTFKDNEPIGEFKRYYINGDPISILYYHESSDSVDAVFYHPNKFLAAKGIYIDKSKEGEWVFYSSKKENCKICIESYTNNQKEGNSTKYHLNGNIAEELTYINDLKNGSWMQYYSDGTLCIKSQYLNNSLNGLFETFHTGGKKEITGRYQNDTREGEWKFFDENGSFKRTIIFKNGVAENDRELIEEQTKYLDQLEKDGGKIKDPEKTGIIW